jgi:hypothetical protein
MIFEEDAYKKVVFKKAKSKIGWIITLFIISVILFARQEAVSLIFGIIFLVIVILGGIFAVKSKNTAVISFGEKGILYQRDEIPWEKIGGITLKEIEVRDSRGYYHNHDSLIFIRDDGAMLFGVNTNRLVDDEVLIWQKLSEEWHQHHPGKKMIRIRKD